MTKKTQLPVLGGLRKVLGASGNTAAGTTIAEFGSATVTLAQLATALGTLIAPSSGTINSTTGAAPGAPGAPGASGSPGRTVWLPADEYDDPVIIPGLKGTAGNPGTSGASGLTVVLPADEYDDPVIIPGPRGPIGLTGAPGSGGSGTSGSIYIVPDEAEDPTPIPGPPGPAAAIILGGGVPATFGNLVFWFQADTLPANDSFYPILANQAPSLAAYPSTLTIGAGITVSATLNSLNVATFNGSTTYALGGSGPTLAASTIFVVVNLAATSGSPVIFGSSAAGALECYINGSGQLALVTQSVALVGAGTTAMSIGTWYQANTTFDGTNWSFRQAQAANGSGSTIAGVSAGSAGVCATLSARVAELIVYNQVLTGPEIATVENYLFSKWGV